MGLWKIESFGSFTGFSRRFGQCPAFRLFPDTAWQNIEDKERSELVADLNDFSRDPQRALWNRLKINTLRELEAPNVNSIQSLRLSP